MRLELGCLVLSVAALGACASAPETPSVASNRGMLTVAGVSPAQALAAIDTTKLVKSEPVGTNATTAEATPAARADLPPGQKAVAIEGVKPSDVLAAIDTSKLVDGDKSKSSDKASDKSSKTTKQ